jgi:hypothetical protein
VLFACRFVFPLHEPRISEELVTLNRRGVTARPRSYVLPAFVLLAAFAVVLLSLGSSRVSTRATGYAPSSFLAPTAPQQERIDHFPVIFEANQGQAEPQVKFLARGHGYALLLTQQAAILNLRSAQNGVSQVRMQLANANPAAALNGNQLLPGKTNYLVGDNPGKWRRNIPQFGQVRYTSVYPGIDLVYYGTEGKLEYDFEVAPAVDPSQIALQFDGAGQVSLSPEGDLLLAGDATGLRLQAPRIYQKSEKGTEPVEGRFVIRNGQEVGFAVGNYDRRRALIIDPVLVYSRYLGGNGVESAAQIAVDASSNMYLAFATTSTDSVGCTTGCHTTPAGGGDVLITKLDSGGTIVFQTYLGGTGNDVPAGIGIDSGFNVVVAGTTTSADFPTLNPFQSAPSTAGTQHAFVISLNRTVSGLVYGTYLRGNGIDIAKGLALDVKNKLYVIGTTTSTDLPTTAGAFHTTSLATNQFFVAKIDPVTTGTESVPYLTYFGGGNPSNGVVVGGGIAVDSNSNVYITGGTNFANTGTNANTDFPIVNAFENCLNAPTKPTTCPTPAAQTDAFVAKLNPSAAVGDQLQYSTYVGGTSDDVANAIALDSSANAYITGSTTSNDWASAGTNPFQGSAPGGGDSFLVKLSSFTPSTSSTSTTTVTELYRTYLGGSGNDIGFAIASESAPGVPGGPGVRIAGSTTSNNLTPLSPGNTFAGGTDGFAARVDTTSTVSASAGSYSYIGGGGADEATGIAVDARGASYVVGDTTSANFPVVAATSSLDGGSDAFISKFGPVANLAMTAKANPELPALAGIGNQVTFTYTIKNNGDLINGVIFSEQFTTASGTFSSATASPGSCAAPSGSNLSCNIGVLNANATATVTVVMTPTAKGPFGNSATVTVAGTGFTTSATASATVADFAMTVNPPTRTTPAGTPVTYSVTVSPDGAASFPSNVSLSCGTGLPTAAACEFINNPITNLSTGPQSRTLTLNTTARVTTTTELRHSPGPLFATWLPVSGLAFLGLGGAAMSRRRKILLSVLFGLFLTALAFQVGCGSDKESTTTTTGTPAGTYTVTINATSGSATRTGTVQIEVQ